MKKVSVFLANGFEEIEGLTVVDLLRRAEVEVTTVSITGEKTIHGAHGIDVQADKLFEEMDYENQDMLVLPGGMPGTTNLKEHEGVRRVVKDFVEEGKPVGAICAAPTILADLDLLKGKRVTCYPSCEADIQGAVLTHAPVAVDGNIITGQGVGSAIDFALKLVEKLEGPEKAKEIAEAIVYN